MWVADIELSGSKALLGRLSEKYDVNIVAYPISSCQDKNGLSVHFVAFISGESSSKDKFLKELVKADRFLHIERNGDFIIGQIKESIQHKSAYKASIIHVEPIRIYSNGTEFWTIASWNRDDLIDFVDATELSHKTKIIKVVRKKIDNFAFLSVYPSLTPKQKTALEHAVKNGYYNYPRNIDLKELAKKANLSYSTYQAHLRKAERNILPWNFNYYNQLKELRDGNGSL